MNITEQYEKVIALGEARGFLFYSEIKDLLPGVADAEETFKNVVENFEGLGIKVVEKFPSEEDGYIDAAHVVCSLDDDYIDEKKITQDLASAMAGLSNLLQQSIFNQHGLQENDYQKARRLFEDGQYKLALEHISKFKREIMDDNPYPYGSEKGMSVSVSFNAYKIMANCYRSLHKYIEALNTLVDMRNMFHNVLCGDTLQNISETYAEWKKEAEDCGALQARTETSMMI